MQKIVEQQMYETLIRARDLCRIALPQFNWGASALGAEAIQLLNEVPGEIELALREYNGSHHAPAPVEVHVTGPLELEPMTDEPYPNPSGRTTLDDR